MTPSPIKLFLDFEFTSLDGDPKPISLALVDENDEHRLYIELRDGWCKRDCSTFALDEVLPLLEGGAVTRAQARRKILAYLNQFQGGRVKIHTDAPVYDWPLLMNLLGELPAHVEQTPGIEPACEDEAEALRMEQVCLIHGWTRHHALHDALVMRWMAQYGHLYEEAAEYKSALQASSQAAPMPPEPVTDCV